MRFGQLQFGSWPVEIVHSEIYSTVIPSQQVLETVAFNKNDQWEEKNIFSEQEFFYEQRI
jgi:hypothetical protein